MVGRLPRSGGWWAKLPYQGVVKTEERLARAWDSVPCCRYSSQRCEIFDRDTLEALEARPAVIAVIA